MTDQPQREPMIVRVHGVWNCMVWPRDTEQGKEIVCGLGYTPDAAYEDWKRLIAKTEEAS